MSGVTGNQKIPSRSDFKKILKDYTKIISKFPGFVNIETSGSYNSNKDKTTFGDIDLILNLKGYDDTKKVKVKLAKYLTSQPEDVIVPFESPKYKGRRYYNSGEIITVSYQAKDKSILPCQIDNIIALSDSEAKFKKDFLDMPAEKQGLVLGLVKVALLEFDGEKILKNLGITAPSLEENDEIEFNLSSKELQLRLVTYDKEKLSKGEYKTINKEVIWRSRDWNKLEIILDKIDLSLSFEELIIKIKKTVKLPRTINRLKGVFKSMISIKSGEIGKEKGDNKQRALDIVDKLMIESFIRTAIKRVKDEESNINKVNQKEKPTFPEKKVVIKPK